MSSEINCWEWVLQTLGSLHTGITADTGITGFTADTGITGFTADTGITGIQTLGSLQTLACMRRHSMGSLAHWNHQTRLNVIKKP